MIVLSIDSSSKVATVAILKDDVLLGEYILNDKREHAVMLVPLIENLLKECNLTMDDIDGYVVSKGPGSFTGLRIGMATVKGMSFGNNKPYISISSLDALAYNLISFNGIICPIMDALRENVYTALYRNNNDNLEKIMDYTAMDIDKLVDLLKNKNEDVIFVGDGVYKHKQYICDNFSKAHFAPTHLNIIRASSLGELGLKLLKDGVYDDSNSSPIYLKKPQAERELERRLNANHES